MSTPVTPECRGHAQRTPRSLETTPPRPRRVDPSSIACRPSYRSCGPTETVVVLDPRPVQGRGEVWSQRSRHLRPTNLPTRPWDDGRLVGLVRRSQSYDNCKPRSRKERIPDRTRDTLRLDVWTGGGCSTVPGKGGRRVSVYGGL